MKEIEPTAPTAESSSEPRTLNAQELEALADKIIELMQREIKIDREREGKPR